MTWLRLYKMGGLSLVLALFTGCLNVGDDLYEPIEGNVVLDMYEQLDSVHRMFAMVVKTEKLYDCSNYFIESDITLEDSVLVVKLKRIFKDNVCYTDMGPASCLISFTDGAWHKQKFRIEMDNFSREGVIVKDTNEYRMDIMDSRPLLVEKDVLKRVPVNTVWGNLEYDLSSSFSYVDSFFMYMDTIGATPSIYEDGQYNFFEIENGTITDPGSANAKYNRAFILNFEGDFGRITRLADYIAFKSQDIRFNISSSDADHAEVAY